MKLASSFPVPAAPDKVLALFLDPATMQACIPGCEELVQVDDTRYQGSLVNEVAHVKFKAGFSADITSRTTPTDTSEPAVVTAVLKGEDRRLGSTIKIDATLTVSPLTTDDGGTSEVSYEFELAMWGKLGRLGESVIRRRTSEVEKQFAEALTAVCAGQPVPQRVDKKAARRAAQTPLTPSPGASAVQASHGTTSGAHAGQPQPTSAAASGPAAPATYAASPSGERSREDYLVLGLALAAAFAYGVIFGGRRGARR
jgi:carbon monoxide dehydrogenase subunit G